MVYACSAIRWLWFILGVNLSAAFLHPAEVARPEGRFLFQPMLIWGTSEVTQQGTGYLIQHEGKWFGVTSTHFLDFGKKGLFEAIWLDIPSDEPVIGFKKGLGKPERTEIERHTDIEHDFLLLPAEVPPAKAAGLQLDAEGNYAAGTKLWFPNKSTKAETGYEWVEGEIVKDEGYMIRVKLLSRVALRSQSGSPFLRQDNGRVVGMLMGSEGKEILLCPSRSLLKRLKSGAAEVPLMEAIRK